MSIKCQFKTFGQSLNGKLIEIKYGRVGENRIQKLENHPFVFQVERTRIKSRVFEQRFNKMSFGLVFENRIQFLL